MLGPILSIVGHAVVDVIVTVITHKQKEVIYMVGRKDNVVVAVIGDLTATQAAQLQKQIVVAKGRYASNGRGTIATGTRENVGVLIQSGSTSSKRIAKNAQKERYYMFYDLMNTSDRVLTITNDFLAIERCDYKFRFKRRIFCQIKQKAYTGSLILRPFSRSGNCAVGR